jgi:hypothetical protein
LREDADILEIYGRLTWVPMALERYRV